MISSGICGYIVFLSLTLAVAGQETTFKSNTELVQVPVVASRKGTPAKGLNKSNFTLLLDGKPQAIEVFEEVDPSIDNGTPEALPTNTAQNYIVNPHGDLVIIVLDITSGSFSYARTWAYLDDLCHGLANSGTPVSMMLLTNRGLIQVHSFAAPPEELRTVVKQLAEHSLTPSPIEPTVPSRAVQPSMPLPASDGANEITWTPNTADATQTRAAYMEELYFNQNIPEAALDPVNTVAQAFRGVPGRKKLIWVSTNFAGEKVKFERQPSTTQALRAFRMADVADQAWKAMSTANIAVYPIDSNGVVNPAFRPNSDRNYDVAASTQDSYFDGPAAVSSDISSMMEVAHNTGGRTCSDFLDKCVDRVVQDGQHYYLLGFYLEHKLRDGWHDIKITSSEKDVSLRHRRGFSAGEDRVYAQENRPLYINDVRSGAVSAKTFSSTHRKDPVLTALAAPIDYTDIPLRMHWLDTGKQQVELTISSPPGGIRLDPDKKVMRIDLLVYVKELGKKTGDSLPQSIVTKPDAKQQEMLARNGFSYKRRLTLPPGRYGIRFLIRDNVTGNIGTVSTLINVRPGT